MYPCTEPASLLVHKSKDVACYYQELVIPVSRERLVKACIVDGHNLMPKLHPGVFKSIRYIKGHVQPGSIRETILSEETGLAGGVPLLYRIDTFDCKNYVFKQTLIQGGMLFENMHSVVYELQVVALGSNKCICKVSSEYHSKDGVEFNEEDIKVGKYVTWGFYQAINDYLIDNPDAYA